jgi:glyoxylase-like metal-dependent hydrolase (beta-lactamase superfamily II)
VAQVAWGRIERVADGVWALISTPLQDRTTLCNGGIIRGSAGVLVLESYAQPKGATWLAEQAKALTGRWPDDVVLTHYHGDHTAGIAGYGREDGAPHLRATQVTRELVRAQDAQRNEDPSSPRSKLIAGVTLIDGAAESVIDLGDRRVRIVPREGHTKSDITVELDEPSVVFCGDLVWNQMFPNYVDAVPSRLSRAVNGLTRSARTMYVPGHGPLAEPADLRRYVALLDSVEQGARAAKAKGQTAAEAAAEYRLPADIANWTLFSPRYPETAIGAWLRELSA